MRRRLPLLPLALLLPALAGCGPAAREADPAPGRAAVEAELQAVYDEFAEAYAAADVDVLMREVYAPDAYYLPPGSPILAGQERFRGQFEGFLGPIAEAGRPGPRISFEIVDRDISGDLAYDIGYYTLRPPGAPEGAAGSRGKFIVIWKRDAQGRWRMHADGFSGVD
jgi:ketosteroid isomerase-like protein